MARLLPARTLSLALFATAFGVPGLRAEADEPAAPPPPRIEVALHASARIPAEGSLVWAATMQLAWDALVEEAGKDGSPHVERQRDHEAVMLLNRRSFPHDALDEASQVVVAGRYEDGVLDRLAATWVARFGTETPVPEIDLGPGDLLGFAALRKRLRFAMPFHVAEEPLRFGGRSVRAFGTREADLSEEGALLAKQVLVHFEAESLPSERWSDGEGAGWVVELLPEDRGDRVLLSSLDPKATLRETWLAAWKRVEKGVHVPLPPGTRLDVPRVRLGVERDFKELVGEPVGNRDGWYVTKARQQVTFALTEEGASATSEAVIVALRGAAPRVAFRDPFLVALIRHDASEPYLLLWVGDAGLLEPVP